MSVHKPTPTYLRVGLVGSVSFKLSSLARALATAQPQLKQAEDARKALAQATQVFETKLPKLESGDLGENWPEWLIARILLREARGLIEKK